MRRLITLLSFVLCLFALSAQTNVDNLIKDNYLAEISNQEDSILPQVTTSEEILVAQNTIPSYKDTKEWEKYIKLRKWGWGLFGGGLGSVLLGGCALVERVSGYNNGAAIGGPLIVAGTLATLSSVPVLICAYHQKHKAKNLQIGVSTIPTINYQLEYSYSPALSISYSF